MSKADGLLRVGIVGIGFGQQAHVPAFRQNAHCRIEAIGASDRARARAVADRLSIPKAYGDWRALVADPDVDVVTIATPPSLQSDIALFALAQGKPVFCEKPLAATTLAASAMLDAARRAGVPHMVDFGFTAIDEWIQARAILDRGEMGRLRRVAVAWHTETYAVRHGLKSWKTAGVESGGGVLNNFVSMVLHYVEWLAGPIARLTATLSTTAVGTFLAETEAVLCLELDGGALASVSVSNSARLGSGHRIEIYGDEGTLVLDNAASSGLAAFRLLQGDRTSTGLREVTRGHEPGRDGRVDALAVLADRFVRAVLTGGPSSPSFEDGYRVQCLLDAARRSHERGAWVDAREGVTSREATPA